MDTPGNRPDIDAVRSGKIKDLRGAYLANADLSESNLSKANLSGANLSRANLSEANLSESNFSGANLKRANLVRADLEGADLEGADLEGADLEGANLEGVNLEGAKLSESNFSGANLKGADLCWADLEGANLEGANLRRVDLRWANLKVAKLEGANLSRANLSEANLSGSDLRSADLRKADLRRAILSKVDDFRESSIKWIDFSRADLGDAKFDVEGHQIVELERTRILPQRGEVYGWKKCRDGVLVEIRVPDGVPRSNAVGRKCRAQSVEVVRVVPEGAMAVSSHDGTTEYSQGRVVQCHEWDPDRFKECSGGIHFFLTREEAEEFISDHRLSPCGPQAEPEDN